jgi:hypothetical protein
VKVNFSLQHATKAQRESRGTDSSTLSLTLVLDDGWVVNATPQPLFPGEETRQPVCWRLGAGGGGGSGPVWTDAENLAPMGGFELLIGMIPNPVLKILRSELQYF